MRVFCQANKYGSLKSPYVVRCRKLEGGIGCGILCEMCPGPFRGSGYKVYWVAVVFLCLSSGARLTAQATMPQQYTGYPPSVYMQFFLACSPDKPCTRTDKFRVDSVPNGCCILTVTNGDGRGTDETGSYEVFLNGTRVVPVDHSRNAKASVKVLPSNTLKVILTGEPSSKVFVLIDYDPRESK